MLKKGIIIILILCFLATGCGNRNTKKDIGIDVKDKDIRKISVWATYWDMEDLEKEIDKISENIRSISYFAAYFNKDYELFIPEKLDASYKDIRKSYSELKYSSYLTIVNDLIKEDNTSSLKDRELLYKLLSRDDSVDKHIEEIIDMAEKNGFQGIEIDYEGIKGDIDLWMLFANFLEKLEENTSKRNLKLRVLLEPNFPEDKITLPQGPEYVMMCYNLHGKGSKPGPKADKEFILNMIEKMEKLPGNINFAMASGGFKFYDDKAEQLTERQALELAKIHSSHVLRDKKSKGLYFSYIEAGIEYEVWYADYETLDFWFSLVEEAGDGRYGLSLWKLGGNISLDFKNK